MSGESLIPGSQATAFKLCARRVEEGLAASPVFLIRAQTPFTRAPLPGPGHLPRAPPPHTVMLESGCQHMNVPGGWAQTIRP